jgi:uncharacterized membrane protein YdfJ with MMPL/SSD domain
MPVSIFTNDHQATTIAKIVDRVKAFKAANDSDDVTFRLASGNVGVMAATNEVVAAALKQRGTASIFTAVTMTVSVATWAFSALKFQADMGILLAFMFLVNMLGAILLLPALAAFLVGERLREPAQTRARPG